MEKILPYHNYIVVTPKGEIEGFEEVDNANAYILGYFVKKIDDIGNDPDYVYTDNVAEPFESSINISRELGVYEGECRIYELESLIENVRTSGIFDDEKEFIISKLMEEEIDLNVNDHQLDEFLVNTKQMERHC